MLHTLDSFKDHPFFTGGLALMVIGYATAMLRSVPHKLFELLRRRYIVTVQIREGDEAFGWAQQWLAMNESGIKTSNFLVRTIYSRGSRTQSIGACNPGEIDSNEREVQLVPGEGTHLVRYRGRPLVLTRGHKDSQAGGVSYSQSFLEFRFIGGGKSMAQALIEEMRELGTRKDDGLRILTARHGSWSSSGPAQAKRPLESVFLADGIIETLLADMRRFLDSPTWYAERGIPYRRGYLLHGPPGTGKTTTVAAIAGKLDLAVAIMSPASMNDGQLIAFMETLPPKSILLIEDIDCIFAGERKTKAGTSVTVSGLLNAIDGIGSKDGRILFLTTNHPERLDAALVRPGRIDRKFELSYATWEQLERAFRWFFRDAGLSDDQLKMYSHAFAAMMPAQCSMAQAQQELLLHRDDPYAFVRRFTCAA